MTPVMKCSQRKDNASFKQSIQTNNTNDQQEQSTIGGTMNRNDE